MPLLTFGPPTLLSNGLLQSALQFPNVGPTNLDCFDSRLAIFPSASDCLEILAIFIHFNGSRGKYLPLAKRTLDENVRNLATNEKSICMSKVCSVFISNRRRSTP